MSKKHITVTIPKEEMEDDKKKSFFLKDTDKAQDVGIIGIFEIIACFFVITQSLVIRLNGEDLGQERPREIFDQFIQPALYSYTILFSIIGTIPFIILRCKGVSSDNYPKSRNYFKNSVLSTIIVNFVFAYNIATTIYAIMGPIYYLQFRNNSTDPIDSQEAALVTAYAFAFILAFRIWVYFATGAVNCFWNMVNMWKFTVLQLRDQREILV
ncbi:hypothetical protein BD770DRAFT_475972 [Pilaira anomala]|nr:hypothetical protein BD770DRAFT_475972 [Pilaira anomala]